MRHRNHSQRLARKPDQARSLLKNLATSILLYERVRTTKKRAQVVRGIVDRIITIGKSERKDLAIRRINTMVLDDNACRKVIEVLVDRYANRRSGFTRITPLGAREGDGAMFCEISLIDAVDPTVVETSKEAVVKTPKIAKPKKKASPSTK